MTAYQVYLNQMFDAMSDQIVGRNAICDASKYLKYHPLLHTQDVWPPPKATFLLHFSNVLQDMRWQQFRSEISNEHLVEYLVESLVEHLVGHLVGHWVEYLVGHLVEHLVEHLGRTFQSDIWSNIWSDIWSDIWVGHFGRTFGQTFGRTFRSGISVENLDCIERLYQVTTDLSEGFHICLCFIQKKSAKIIPHFGGLFAVASLLRGIQGTTFLRPMLSARVQILVDEIFLKCLYGHLQD